MIGTTHLINYVGRYVPNRFKFSLSYIPTDAVKYLQHLNIEGRYLGTEHIILLFTEICFRQFSILFDQPVYFTK